MQPIKVIMLGNSGVGKTTLLQSYLNGQQKQEVTIGVEHYSKLINNVKLSIWDTAGQEKYRSVISSYYKRAKAAILVFDCSNEHSLESIDPWIDELIFQAGQDIIIALVANKTDIANFDYNKKVQTLQDKYDIIKYIATNHIEQDLAMKMEQLFFEIVASQPHQQSQIQQQSMLKPREQIFDKSVQEIHIQNQSLVHPTNSAPPEQKQCEC